jgi:hypothetical protein
MRAGHLHVAQEKILSELSDLFSAPLGLGIIPFPLPVSKNCIIMQFRQETPVSDAL